MSGAELLRDLRRKWAQYKTLPPSQGGQDVSTTAATTVGTAHHLRGTPRFLQDVAHYVDLVLDMLERLCRRVEKLEQGPAPVPLLLPEPVEDELLWLREQVVQLNEDVRDDKRGLVPRTVRLEYQIRQDPHAHEGWLTGLTVVGALFSAGCLLGCVGALVWTLATVHEFREGSGNGSPVRAEGSTRAAETADGAQEVREAARAVGPNTQREEP